MWGALLEAGASHRVEGEHLECRGGRLLQRRAAALQEPHQRLHPARLCNLRGGGRVEGQVLERARGRLLRRLVPQRQELDPWSLTSAGGEDA